jgi:glycosyltransferase involved in cell wall biosynthesis
VRVAGVVDPRSVGIARYCRELQRSLAAAGIDYPLTARPSAEHVHVHFGNSSRRVLPGTAVRRAPFVVTVHDVSPRTPAIEPAYRLAAFPLLRRARLLIAHSRVAADLLVTRAGIRADRIRIIPHGTRRPEIADRDAALARIGLAAGPPLVILPGVLKAAKLTRDAVIAAEPLMRSGRLRLALVGRVSDETVAAEARALGALVIDSPDDPTYDAAIVAADVVLVLRRGSVGETNGPLMDALGAGRAVLATPTGSIPELAGSAARYCDVEIQSIRAGLSRLLDDGERAEREILAASRGTEMSWERAAHNHVSVFEEAFAA